MSELRRWSEEGATEEEQRLLTASMREVPHANARKRTLQALGVGTVLTTVSTAMGASGGMGVALKIIGIAVIVSGVAGGAAAWRGSRNLAPVPSAPSLAAMPERSAQPALIVPVAPAEEPSAARPEVDAGVSIGAVDPAPDLPAHAAHTARVEASAPSLSREVAALERAHALATHDPNGALRELDRYRARFPGGALSAEETVLRVQALLAAGNEDKARTLADAFSAEHPDSPYARRIEDLVRAKKK